MILEVSTEVSKERYMSMDVSTEVSKGRNFRSIPPVYAPSFVIPHGNDYQNQTFCIPSDGSYHVRSVPEMRGTFSLASCYGWLILQNFYSDECHLFNPVTLNKIQLPPIQNDTFTHGVLSCPPADPKCVVMFFGYENDRNWCIFCRIGDKTWIEQAILEHIQRCRSAVSSNGMIYLLFEERIAVIDVQDNLASIKSYEIQEDPQWVKRYSVKPIPYMLESRGDIFQVRAIRLGYSTVYQNFIVFKLDFSKMAWVHVESLGDRIFFLSGNSGSASTSASEFGTNGNCLYFCAYGSTDLCRFDLEVGTITVILPCSIKFRMWDACFWVIPNCKVHVKKLVKVATEEIPLATSNLLPELLPGIFHSLYLGGRIRFRLASKACLSLSSPMQSFSPQILDQHVPWLISLPNTKEKKICHLYHPIYTDVYTMSLPQLAGAIVRHAKCGWLLMSKGQTSIFFFNPITLETIKLPSHAEFLGISFSAPPTSSDCVVFGLCFHCPLWIEMSVYRKTQNRWFQHRLLDLPYSFVPAACNPVFHDGVFYCLSKDGKLGVFNPNAANEEDMWMVYTDLAVPAITVANDLAEESILKVLHISTNSFLMECDDEIFSVFVGFMGKPVRVYKLDQSKTKRKWIKVKSLGDWVMFLSHTTSLLISAGLKGTENRIYFPRFKENASIYYSLTSEKYHYFGDQDSCQDWVNTCENWNCTWFQTSGNWGNTS